MLQSRQRKNFAKAVVDNAIRKSMKGAESDSQIKRAFTSLLHYVQIATELLRVETGGGHIETAGLERVVNGLFALARHQKDWLRPIEAWRPTPKSPLPQ